MTDELEWAEPVPVNRGRGMSKEVDKIVAALQARPGKWAIVRRFEKASSLGSSYATWKNRGLEVTGRKQEDGTGVLYARWPEEGSDGEEAEAVV